MDYVVNLMETEPDPREWARRREAEGWQVLSVADHFFTTNRPYPHIWVTATAMAMATTTARVTTSFANNLFRSPVEVAQAGLQLARLSDGRFDLGLGAGWAADEAVGGGLEYPSAGVRAGRYAEAVQIVRQLLHEGSCTFSGAHYSIDVPALGPLLDRPPALVGSVGGPRTIREVTPHLDRVELKPQSAATRGGALDISMLGTITEAHVHELIDRVRTVRPDIELGMFVLCSAGDDAATTHMRDAIAAGGGGLFERFFGPPEHVAEGLAWLAELGFTRAQLSPPSGATFERLAPVLFR